MGFFKEVDIDSETAMAVVSMEGREKVGNCESCEPGANDGDTKSSLGNRIAFLD